MTTQLINASEVPNGILERLIEESGELDATTGIETATVSWFVFSDSKFDGYLTVISTQGIPNTGTLHYDGNSWVTRLKAKKIDTVTYNNTKGYLWRVTANFSSEFELNEDPLLEPAKVVWETEDREEEIWYDRDEKAIINSAGDIIDPLSQEFGITYANIEQNIQSLPSFLLTTRKPSTNASAFTFMGLAVADDVCKVSKISVSELKRRNGIEYYILRLTFSFDPRKWYKYPVNAGLNELAPFYGNQVFKSRCTTDDGNPVTSAVPLDDLGAQIDEPDETNIIRLEVKSVPQIDFSPILALLIGV